MEYHEIATQLHIKESVARELTSRALRKTAQAGEMETFSSVVHLGAATRVDAEISLARLEKRVARAKRLAQTARLKPRVIAELREIERRVKKCRHALSVASVYIRCGSIECRPEKWVFFACR